MKKAKYHKKVDKIRTRLSVNNELITEDRKRILSYQIVDLVTKLREGDLDPVSVLEAYQVISNFFFLHIIYIYKISSIWSPIFLFKTFPKYQAQALIATEKTNCIVDFCEESREIAEELKHVPKEKRGPLHGLPISIKECFHIKGYDHTIGLAKEIDNPSEDDGSFIKVSVSDFYVFH